MRDVMDSDDLEALIVNEAVKLCKKYAGNKRNVFGTVKCPKCGGNLHYFIAGNGHVRGKCDTPGCLSWME